MYIFKEYTRKNSIRAIVSIKYKNVISKTHDLILKYIKVKYV